MITYITEEKSVFGTSYWFDVDGTEYVLVPTFEDSYSLVDSEGFPVFDQELYIELLEMLNNL